MSKIFITGSSDGIGLQTAKELIKLGHEVVLHARNEKKAIELKSHLKNSNKILVGDLTSIYETKQLANEINSLGNFDTIIHNAGVFKNDKSEIFKVNVLAPYILTACVKKPKKIIYIGSNMHPQGVVDLDNLSIENGVDYSTSKLLLSIFSLALSKKWKNVLVNTVDPGWVKTKMANYEAPDSLEDGSNTQVWLTSHKSFKDTGKYFHHLKEIRYCDIVYDEEIQKSLIEKIEKITNIYI